MIRFNLFKALVLILIWIAAIPAYPQTNPPDPLKQLESEVRTNLTTNILPFWSGEMFDPAGGFYGQMDEKNQLYKDSERGGVLNARILWTFSAAFNILHDSAYLETATHARDYIMQNFIDTEFGGGYWSVSSEGVPQDTRKQIYAQSFYIYGLAEYYRATGDQESLAAAIDLFNLLEKHSFDNKLNGYFESYSREWQRIPADILGGDGEKDAKGMNTHIHILEAYTTLYHAWPDEKVAERLRNLIVIFCEKFIHPDNSHLIIYYSEDWKPTSTFYSYGHDIELSWLLTEAAHLLGDPELVATVEEICIKMVEAVGEAIQPDGSLVYEKDPSSGHMNTSRQYWTQAEAIVGLVNAFEITGNEAYLENALYCWKYIKKHLVDHENGGWYSGVSDSGIKGSKAGPWKGPYHHSRMCMEVIKRCSE